MRIFGLNFLFIPFNCQGRVRAAGKQLGMTLIEIIIVISLIGTVMAIIIGNVVGQRDEALKDAANLGMQGLSQAVTNFRVHNFKYPTTEQGLNSLVTNPGNAKKWRGPYTEETKLQDPWGNTYEYESDGRTYKITSGGPDGVTGTEDDISFPADTNKTE